MKRLLTVLCTVCIGISMTACSIPTRSTTRTDNSDPRNVYDDSSVSSESFGYDDYDDYDDYGDYEVSEKITGLHTWEDDQSTVQLDYAGETITFSCEDASDYGYTLQINGEPTDLDFLYIGYIQIIDDTILLSTGGTDVLSTTLYALDMNGYIFLEVSQLESNGMKIADNDEEFEIIRGDTVFLQGSRQYHGPSLLRGNEMIDLMMGEDGYTSSLPDDEVVRADL